MSKIILTDVDGVLLDWEKGFNSWVKEKGFVAKNATEKVYDISHRLGVSKEKGMKLVEEFNHCLQQGMLEPIRNAVYYVRKMYQEGWRFVAITALSEAEHAKALRLHNLENVFGKGIFKELVCLPTAGDKTEALSRYKNSGLIWIEDKFENAVLGEKLGLFSVLIKHPHNSYQDSNIPCVDCWESVYEIAIKSLEMKHLKEA